MGGVVDFVKDVFVDPIKEIVDAPINIVVDTIRGKSFTGAIEKETADIINALAKGMQRVYTDVLEPLGVDDEGFFIFKGGIFAKMGQFVKDTMHDHAHTTVGIAVIVATIYFAWMYAPQLMTMFGAEMTLLAYEAGVAVSATALMGVYYGSMMIASFGLSAVMSGLISGSILGMYGELNYELLQYEYHQEKIKLASFGAVMSGSIFDRFAGGDLYNEVQAGGELYSIDQKPPLDASVLGEFKVEDLTRDLSYPFVTHAGDQFDMQFDLLPIKL